jgi:hypothetical protein
MTSLKSLWKPGAIIFGFLIPSALFAQPEVMAWGNITGIRAEGQLMEFESSLRIVEKGWMNYSATGKEKQQPKYDRDGLKQTITTDMNGFRFSEVVEESGKGIATVTLKATAPIDTIVEGVFLCIELPAKYYSDSKIKFIKGSPASRSKVNIPDLPSEKGEKRFKVKANGMVITSLQRQLEINFDTDMPVLLRKEDGSSGVMIYICLMGPEIKKGQEVQRSIKIKATGEIDRSPAEIILNPLQPGRKFAGLGGNFRLQNPKTDPPVISYCLDNLRVAWGRVEMPWNLWHPIENNNPIEAAISGHLDSRVRSAMEMARRLDSIGIPIIISDWSAPNWAILGDPRDAYRYRSKGIYGYQLNPAKMDGIYQSIGDYLVYLKQHYGVEAKAFSFNESDLGINIRHTGKEHAEFIKGLGAYLASRGLSTKLLLGDNSDATTFDFIVPAMNDPETHKYIAAISFHSWRGCTDEILQKWAGAAKQMNLPLIVAEGSTDAAAWNYPEIFSEASFALYEINLYMRLCAICQPVSILQWQLTADYSLLTGNGIFGTTGPLLPTQRFWNLKQLASTPEGAFAIPAASSKEDINCAAFGNISRGKYAVHIVNNGAEREVVVKGIPPAVKHFTIYVTDQHRSMEKTGEVQVMNGNAGFKLSPAGFTSLISE